MWLEHLARGSSASNTFKCHFTGNEIDWREMLAAIIDARSRGRTSEDIARAFHRGLADGLARAVVELAQTAGVDTVVFSGGVMQNDLLLSDLRDSLESSGLDLWVNRVVPPNDGGVSLGQAALAIFANPGA
jgi:hydrogenase maturation protein HypF